MRNITEITDSELKAACEGYELLIKSLMVKNEMSREQAELFLSLYLLNNISNFLKKVKKEVF